MISCQQYDYIEIACLYQFPVRLTLTDGVIFEGIANDTRYDNHHQECLLLQTGQGAQLVPTARLQSLEVMLVNPHFTFIKFGS